MKKTLLTLAAIMVCSVMMAQDAAEQAPVEKDWKWSGIVGLNANATGMVNWAAGGKNNVTGTVFGKVRCLYDKNDLSWETNLDIEYGMSYVDQKYDKVQKASDHLKFNTKFGWAFKKTWYLTVNAGFQTQFDLGRDYTGTAAPNKVISNILAPSYTDISVGIDWKPNSIFSVYLSPVAGRIATAYVSDNVQDRFKDYNRELAIFNGEDPSAYGDYDLRRALQEANGTWKYTDHGDDGYTKEYKNAKAELGLTLKGGINYEYKGLKVITNVTLFTPYAWDKTKLYNMEIGGTTYIYSESQMEEKFGTTDVGEYLGYRDNNRRFGNFDVDWDVTLSYQLLKCLNLSLTTNLKYVNGLMIDGGKEKVQFLANLGLGVSYAF
ncbi:MAG: DUF3078 domain-containing protein [Bacteroidales bacterium]|nr:DUF3078 domain-containing protein [Candidatus Colicola equi]